MLQWNVQEMPNLLQDTPEKDERLKTPGTTQGNALEIYHRHDVKWLTVLDILRSLESAKG